jgi:type II secretory pathway pseudopilin PulG
MQRARQNEARVNLNVIHMAQKVYRLNRNTYWNGGNGVTAATINTSLGTELSVQNFTTYNITGNATTYTATTTGQGKTFTMTQTGTLTET